VTSGRRLDPRERERLLRRNVRRDEAPAEEFTGREAEMQEYLRRGAGRLATSLALVEPVLAARPRARVLELGADPWFFTQLLLDRGVRVTSAGQQPGTWTGGAPRPSPQHITIEWDSRTEPLEHHLFARAGPGYGAGFSIVSIWARCRRPE
jgi:hypothetical protein